MSEQQHAQRKNRVRADEILNSWGVISQCGTRYRILASYWTDSGSGTYGGRPTKVLECLSESYMGHSRPMFQTYFVMAADEVLYLTESGDVLLTPHNSVVMRESSVQTVLHVIRGECAFPK